MNGPVPVPAFVPRATAEDLLRVRANERLMGLVSRCQINIGYYVTELFRLGSWPPTCSSTSSGLGEAPGPRAGSGSGEDRSLASGDGRS